MLGIAPGTGGFGSFGGFGTFGSLDVQGRAHLQDGDSLAGAPEDVRRGFAAKVYGILGAQLALTFLVAGAVAHQGGDFAARRPNTAMALLFSSVVISMAMMLVFSCCPRTMRKAPLNYALLFLFTCGKGTVLGFVSVQFTKASVLLAVALTLFVVVTLTIFACCTSMDFTGYAPYMGSAIMVLCGFGFFIMLANMFGLGHSHAFQYLPMIYAAMGAMVFSAYLIFDLQLITGGRHHKYEFGIDDYAMAAICVYTDIVQLFIFLLQLVGERQKRPSM